MLKITRFGDIRIPRGDSGYFEVKRTKDGEILPFEEGDTLTFTVKKDASEETVLIQKQVSTFDDDGVAMFRLDPSDTASLAFGVYRYDVQATYASGDIDTLVGPGNFYVGEEITSE